MFVSGITMCAKFCRKLVQRFVELYYVEFLNSRSISVIITPLATDTVYKDQDHQDPTLAERMRLNTI